MKKTCTTVLALLAFTALSIVSYAKNKTAVPAWQDARVNSVNRLPMRSNFDTDAPMLSLNGIWAFNFCEDSSAASKDFFKEGFDYSSWDSIPVPGLWDVNGFCDPLYVNIPYPWHGHFPNTPPLVPQEHNYLGQYIRTFNLDESWKGRDAILQIGAAASNVQIWVNGKYVGYSEDSKLEACFDISPYLRTGENIIALEIHRWCDGTYLECQDFWRMAGISRDVRLLSLPKQRLEDMRVVADAKGELSVVMQLSPGVKKLVWRLVDAKSEIKLSGETAAEKTRGRGTMTAQIKGRLNSPKLWSAENPYLYRLEIDVYNSKAVRTQTVSNELGFRSVEIKNSQLLLNGEPILIKGVNRHEMDSYKGALVSEADMLRDILILKQLNFNAVRTCHYPDDPLWYKLCDRYGLYVVDEANNEGHGMGYGEEALAHNPEYASAILERVERMAKRDLNHPCVIIWSLGNESGCGVNFDAAYHWLKAFDSTRPIQYERAVYHSMKFWEYDPKGCTDIACPMYWSPARCEKFLQDNPNRPLIQCEYAHAMGNSMGGFKEYWDMIRKYPEYQGGFIWDFADQALYWRTDASRTGTDHIFAYGGDFNDYDPSDASFNCNGVIAADRSLHPHAYEVAYQQRNILTTASATEALTGQVSVYNEFFFKTLEDYRLDWTVECDGIPVLCGTAPHSLDIKAQTSSLLRLGYNADDVRFACGGNIYDKDVYLTVRYLLKKQDGLLPAGTQVAYDQICISSVDPKAFEADRRGCLNIVETESELCFCGKLKYAGTTTERVSDWKAVFNRKSGSLTSYTLDSKQLVSTPLQPCLFRAATENDLGATGLYKKRLVESQSIWRDAEFVPEKFELETAADGCALVTVCYAPLGDVARISVVYRISPDGSIAIEEKLSDAGTLSSAQLLSRFGMQLSMLGEYSNLEFLGRGPFENYQDRCSAALFGRYRQRVEDQYHYGYVRPQESGTKTGLKWFRITDDYGSGFEISSDCEFSASALPFSPAQMDVLKSGVKHSLELKSLACENHRSDGQTVVNMDLIQSGLGCIDSWYALPLEQYRVEPAPMSFSYVIRPIK